MSNTQSANEKAQIKDTGRDGRLSLRKFGEHQLRREFKDMAIDKCRTEINAFGKCAQDTGLLVVFKCRHLNKALGECMAVHNSHEAFDKYKEENEEALMKKIPGLKQK
eukprot:852729_1